MRPPARQAVVVSGAKRHSSQRSLSRLPVDSIEKLTKRPRSGARRLQIEATSAPTPWAALSSTTSCGFKGDRQDFAAGVAAHVIRRWPNPENRRWFVRIMELVAEMIEENLETKVPLLEFPRTTVRKIKEGLGAGGNTR